MIKEDTIIKSNSNFIGLGEQPELIWHRTCTF